MLGQNLRLFRRRLGAVPLDRFGDPGMELLAAAFQRVALFQRLGGPEVGALARRRSRP